MGEEEGGVRKGIPLYLPSLFSPFVYLPPSPIKSPREQRERYDEGKNPNLYGRHDKEVRSTG